jgi:hypothetical protein
MFRKLTPLLPMAILLGVVSAPALAQPLGHHLTQAKRQMSMYAPGSDAYGSVTPGGYNDPASEIHGLWIQNPDSPRG